MSDLKRQYFEMSEGNRAKITILAAAVFGVALFFIMLRPEILITRSLRADAARLNDQVSLVRAQQQKFEELGRANLKLGSEQLDYLRERGNEVLFEGEIERFLDTMKEINDKVGGNQFSVDEGSPRPAYLSIGPRKDVYTLNMVPLTIDFKGDYAAASNFIFQLRALKRLITIDKIDVVTKDYSSSLNVRINMGLYFIEEI